MNNYDIENVVDFIFGDGYKEIKTVNDFLKKIKEKDKEIERLNELCNKYEEEHKTTFETWQKDIKENGQLHSIIKEVREYIYNKEINTLHFNSKDFLDTSIAGELLEILDKVEDK